MVILMAGMKAHAKPRRKEKLWVVLDWMTIFPLITPGVILIPTESPRCTSYSYDGAGNRVKAVVSDVVTYFPGRHYDDEVVVGWVANSPWLLSIQKMHGSGGKMKKGFEQNKVLGWLLNIVFVMLMTSCQINTETVKIKTINPTFTNTLPGSATITPNSTQTMPITTSTPLPINTWTPQPTLSQEETTERVQKLLTGDDICRLPCWGNIIPGETSWEEAKANLTTFAKVIDTPDNHFKGFKLPNSLEPENSFGMGLRVDKRAKIVEIIYTYRHDFRLDQMLSNYGQPAEVWLHADWNISVLPMNLIYTILLYYPDQGILAAYQGFGEIGDIYEICPSKIDYDYPQPILKLWSPQQQLPIEYVIQNFAPELGEMERYDRIENVELQGMDVQEFFEIYQNPENENVCIQIPAHE